MGMKKLFIIVNEDRFLLSHRRKIVCEAITEGFDVTIVTKDTGKRAEIEGLGARFIELPVNPTGMNPLQELKTLRFLRRLFKREKPDIVHNVGLKCMLWGSLAAKLTKQPAVVNGVSGLGIMFSEANLSLYARAILRIMRFSNNTKRTTYIFQNSDDREIFLTHGVATESQCAFTKGSGVDLNEYIATAEPTDGPITILFTGRMVKEKGVMDLIDAAELLRDKYEDRLRFRLCGSLSDNPKAIKQAELESRCDGRYVEWLGHRTDVKELLQQSHMVVFPSYYREGVPKTLIEACASARPIITTESVGCRDCVEECNNGYIVPIKSPADIARKIEALINDNDLRKRMGAASRAIAERDFSVDTVVKTHIDIYNRINA